MNSFSIDGWRFVVPASSRAQVRCRKCAGASTRAHHRSCPKRGLGQLARGKQARHLELLGTEWALPQRFQVRRGRQGKGISLAAAEAKITRLLTLNRGCTRSELEALAAKTAGIAISRVNVERGATPSSLLVTLPSSVKACALHDVHVALQQEIAGGVYLEVRAVDIEESIPIFVE